MDRPVLKLIDANSNRLTEGLRVCEDIARFILSDRAATRSFKLLRHKASAAIKKLGGKKPPLLISRNSLKDIGKKSSASERRRAGIADIFLANVKRCEEAARVLEEFAKIHDVKISAVFKKMRFDLYGLEKNTAKKLFSLCDN